MTKSPKTSRASVPSLACTDPPPPTKSPPSYFFRCSVSVLGCCHVWPWLIEFSAVPLSCFTLSRLTIFPGASLLKPEVSFNPLFVAILYFNVWVWKPVKCEPKQITSAARQTQHRSKQITSAARQTQHRSKQITSAARQTQHNRLLPSDKGARGPGHGAG